MSAPLDRSDTIPAPRSPRVQGLAEKGFGFGVLIFVDHIIIGAHDRPERVPEHRRPPW